MHPGQLLPASLGLAVAITGGAVLVGLIVDPGTSGGPAERSQVRSVAHDTEQARAVRVLAGWDRRRSSAWAHGSRVRLGRLYVAGSATGRVDLGRFDAWAARGLRVAGMRREIFEVRVRASRPRNLRLLVTDRMVGGYVEHGGQRRNLPVTAVSRHELHLRLDRVGWRLVSLRPG